MYVLSCLNKVLFWKMANRYPINAGCVEHFIQS
jgi:hypothetical protein